MPQLGYATAYGLHQLDNFTTLLTVKHCYRMQVLHVVESKLCLLFPPNLKYDWIHATFLWLPHMVCTCMVLDIYKQTIVTSLSKPLRQCDYIEHAFLYGCLLDCLGYVATWSCGQIDFCLDGSVGMKDTEDN